MASVGSSQLPMLIVSYEIFYFLTSSDWSSGECRDKGGLDYGEQLFLLSKLDFSMVVLDLTVFPET